MGFFGSFPMQRSDIGILGILRFIRLSTFTVQFDLAVRFFAKTGHQSISFHIVFNEQRA